MEEKSSTPENKMFEEQEYSQNTVGIIPIPTLQLLLHHAQKRFTVENTKSYCEEYKIHSEEYKLLLRIQILLLQYFVFQ